MACAYGHVALITSMQRAAMLPPAASLFSPDFLTLPHKGHDFRKQSFWTSNVCFNFLYNFLFETFLILRRIQQDIFMNIETT